MRRRTTVTTCALLALTGSTAGVAAQAPAKKDDGATVSGRSFVAHGPAKWTLTVVKGQHSLKTYQLASHGAVNDLGVPVKDAISVSIYEARVKDSGFKDPDKQTAKKLAPKLIGIPRGATHIKPSSGGTGTLDDEKTVFGTYTYELDGRRLRQQDTVARHGAYSIVVETIADTSRRDAADSARKTVLKRFRWR